MLAAKICLTGGPCAGKTTALSKIEEYLTLMGYKVFIIEEVATRIINGGIKPFGDDKISMLEFEKILLKEQLVSEECFLRAANLTDKKCIIICDRGVFDIKSFLSEDEFMKLLEEENKTRIDIMDQYNLVISLTTAAKNKEEFYTTSNNAARKEGIKEAIIRDDKVIDAWSFHNNFKIVDNSTDFEEKINRTINIIKNYLNIEERKEKKYIVEVTSDMQVFLNEKECVKLNINQVYLNTNDNYEMRLRKRTLDNESTYYITIKKSYKDKEKIVTEEKISEKLYEKLKNERRIINEVNKTRTCFMYNDNVYKLDEFDDGTVILEAKEDAILPPFIKSAEDVTENNNYKNVNMKQGKKYVYKNRKN